MEFSGENLLFPVLKIFDTKCIYNFIHQKFRKTIQNQATKIIMTVMTWDVKETNTGRPLNDFTWFSIKNYMIYNTVSFTILGLSYSEFPCNKNAV